MRDGKAYFAAGNFCIGGGIMANIMRALTCLALSAALLLSLEARGVAARQAMQYPTMKRDAIKYDGMKYPAVKHDAIKHEKVAHTAPKYDRVPHPRFTHPGPHYAAGGGSPAGGSGGAGGSGAGAGGSGPANTQGMKPPLPNVPSKAPGY